MKYERKMMMQRNMKSKNSFKENMRLLCLIWGRKWLANWIDSKNNKRESRQYLNHIWNVNQRDMEMIENRIYPYWKEHRYEIEEYEEILWIERDMSE